MERRKKRRRVKFDDLISEAVHGFEVSPEERIKGYVTPDGVKMEPLSDEEMMEKLRRPGNPPTHDEVIDRINDSEPNALITFKKIKGYIAQEQIFYDHGMCEASMECRKERSLAALEMFLKLYEEYTLFDYAMSDDKLSDEHLKNLSKVEDKLLKYAHDLREIRLDAVNNRIKSDES